MVSYLTLAFDAPARQWVPAHRKLTKGHVRASERKRLSDNAARDIAKATFMAHLLIVPDIILDAALTCLWGMPHKHVSRPYPAGRIE